jgi:type II secretory pathway pseudopilin PulG
MFYRSPIRRRRSEQGYVMLLLLLTVALMIIATAVIVPTITFEIKRDREEEMIHRGVQYSRAIRAYYKKFGRYPAKIEDLENTSQLRFLRKRYKDPLTGKDFRLLHFGEAKMSMNAMGGGVIPGAATLGANGSLNSPNGLAQASGFGNAGAFGASSNSAFGQNSQNSVQTSNSPTTGSDTSQTGTDASQTGSPAAGASAGPGASANPAATGSSGDKLSNTQFGGAPIVGVASISKEKTIREYDKKKKYNEWQFVYDPTFDRGFLITTPYQPQLQMGMQNTPNLNGQINGQQNGTSSGFGNGFGNSPSGMQNNPTSPVGGGFGTPTQPTNPPPQQPPQ